MATYKILDTDEEYFGDDTAFVKIQVEFEKPTGAPRLFVQRIRTYNISLLPDYGMRAVLKADRPKFYQAYADDYQNNFKVA